MPKSKSPVTTARYVSKSNKSLSFIYATQSDANPMDVASNDGLDIDEDADEPKVKSFSNAPSQQEVEDRNVNIYHLDLGASIVFEENQKQTHVQDGS